MDLFEALQKQLDNIRLMSEHTEKMTKKVARERALIEQNLHVTHAIVAINEVLKEGGVSSHKRKLCTTAKEGLYKVLKVRA